MPHLSDHGGVCLRWSPPPRVWHWQCLRCLRLWRDIADVSRLRGPEASVWPPLEVLQHGDQPRPLIRQLVLQPLHHASLKPQLKAGHVRVLDRDFDKLLIRVCKNWYDLVIILKMMEEVPQVVTDRLAPTPLTLALLVQGVQPHVLQGKAVTREGFNGCYQTNLKYFTAPSLEVYSVVRFLFAPRLRVCPMIQHCVFFVCRGMSGYVDRRTFWLLSLSVKG